MKLVLLAALLVTGSCFSQSDAIYLREGIDLYVFADTLAIDTSSFVKYSLEEGFDVGFDFEVDQLSGVVREKEEQTEIVISYFESSIQNEINLKIKGYSCTISKLDFYAGTLLKVDNQSVNVWLLRDRTLLIEILISAGPGRLKIRRVMIKDWEQ